MVITTLNPETIDLEKSYLNTSYSVGTTSIVVKNNDRFAANDRIMLGEMGQEKTEVVTVSNAAADGVTLTIGATLFSHEADTPVYRLRFDQVRFYRSTTTATGTYTLLATVNLDVDNANLSTLYDDTSGLPAYFYKMSVYHSISTLESTASDPIGGSGWQRYQVGNIIDEILQEVSDVNEVHVTRSEVLGYFNDVNDELQTNVSKPYDFLRTRAVYPRTATQNYLDFPTDSNGRQIMWKFERMDYNYIDSTTSPTTNTTQTIPVIGEAEFRNTYMDNTNNATTQVDTTPEAMCLDTAVDRFRFSAPAATTLANVFYLYYWKYFNIINSEGDIIETPTAKIYKLYAKMMYYTKRGITDPLFGQTQQTFTQAYNVEKGKLKMTDRKDMGTPRGMSPRTSVTKSFRR